MGEDGADGSDRRDLRERVEPGDAPGMQRRLERPPSERYREAATAPKAGGGSGAAIQAWRGSLWAAVFGGAAAGAAGVVIFTLAAGGLSFDVGLPIIALYVGWSVAEGVRFGGDQGVARRARIGLAVGLAVLALTVAEAATWAWARSQGGDLPILEHLWTTYGPLLAVQYAAAVVAALWTARR